MRIVNAPTASPFPTTYINPLRGGGARVALLGVSSVVGSITAFYGAVFAYRKYLEYQDEAMMDDYSDDEEAVVEAEVVGKDD